MWTMSLNASHSWMSVVYYLSNLLNMVCRVNKHRVEHHVFIVLIVLILVNHRNSSSNNLDMQ